MSDLLSPASEVANNVEQNAQEVRIRRGGGERILGSQEGMRN